MASHDRSAKRRPAAGEETSGPVPEADAAEQRTPAVDEEAEHWLDRATGESSGEADEGDVVEQLREAGDDDEEHR